MTTMQTFSYDCTAHFVHLYKFTGKERDQETGLDYFGARYFSGAMGRWTSPDQPFADQHLEDPQSWNMYGYVRNNPLSHFDPNGKQCEMIAGHCGAANYPRSQPSAKETMVVGAAVVGVLGAAALGPEIAGSGIGAALYNLATRFFNSPSGQETTRAIGDTITGTPTPSSGEIGAAGEMAAAEFLGGRLAGTAGQGVKITVKGLGSTDIDVIGAAGEYVGVGGPAKGLNLADFGGKLKVLKAAAEQAGVEAQYVFSRGTPQKLIDFTKKRLGEGNVFVLPDQQ